MLLAKLSKGSEVVIDGIVALTDEDYYTSFDSEEITYKVIKRMCLNIKQKIMKRTGVKSCYITFEARLLHIERKQPNESK